ncbi:phosphotransferase [Mycolicibacterium sp. BiH015]|uniref:phosphotransferase enzyme family protein n=1 Tax=Mycolicibacterium sp. BiH015 TaxID=3018808 RepID=UPI0022E93AE7|nr:phosphotransferase [Mycolicibacterium sp. BiH015]MDA2893334.1 phosphotransferase [Mycolicibacterium sp. BiH015]
MATSDEAAQLEPQARNALAQYELPEPLKVELLTFSENAVFRAEFDSHEPVVVRLHSIGYHTETAVRSELKWVEALKKDTDILVPEIMYTPSGKSVIVATSPTFPPRYAAVFGMLPGTSPSSENYVADYRVLGHTTAQLHLHAASWTPPPDFDRFSWNLEGAFGVAPIWGSWRDGPGIGAKEISTLCAAEDLIRRRLIEYGQSPTRYGLIHADLRLPNILIDSGTVYVIDFDDCGFGWFLYDLAGALTFIEDDHQAPQMMASWLEGYTQVRALDEQDLAIIPSLIMMRRMVILAWLGSRPGTPVWREEGPKYAKVTARMANVYLDSLATLVLPA